MRAPIQSLIDQAKDSASRRGHVLNSFSQATGARGRTSAECASCGAWVQVDTDPPANGVDVGGPAVAVDCVPHPANH